MLSFAKRGASGLLDRGPGFFSAHSRALSNPIYDACHQVIKAEHPSDPALWNDVKKQVEMAENISSGKRIATPEELEQIDFGPVLARTYDSREDKQRMAPLYHVYNAVSMTEPPSPKSP